MNENLYSFFAVFALQSGSVAHFREDFTAAKPQPRMNWPQENAKIAEKKRHNRCSLSSLRSFAAIIFLGKWQGRPGFDESWLPQWG
jgi:hypothetical protein